MKIYELRTEVLLPKPISEVFPFFADACNLEALTPEWLRFTVTIPGPIEMRVGTKIDYNLKVRGLPIRWKSEITAWEPPFRFVDEQRKGPYRQWIHEHTFCEVEGGTLTADYVQYAVPGGELIHWLVVKGDVERIFRYRREKMAEIFGAPTGQKAPHSIGYSR